MRDITVRRYHSCISLPTAPHEVGATARSLESARRLKKQWRQHALTEDRYDIKGKMSHIAIHYPEKSMVGLPGHSSGPADLLYRTVRSEHIFYLTKSCMMQIRASLLESLKHIGA